MKETVDPLMPISNIRSGMTIYCHLYTVLLCRSPASVAPPWSEFISFPCSRNHLITAL
ncbi:hypothetical protein BX600DRAFT_467217 [Xylariales sp. PMI_506]|nr:hypothetical protein BX600DRAFT_467217 [Xylariales sp. PMI_506]